MALKLGATVKLNFKNVEAMTRVNEAVLAATQDVFAEIQFTAAERSPVLDKATSERFPGENRDSIRCNVRQTKQGAKARLTTHSGFGGFLELGTVKTPAQPYLWPALEEHIGKIPEAVQAALNEG